MPGLEQAACTASVLNQRCRPTPPPIWLTTVAGLWNDPYNHLPIIIHHLGNRIVLTGAK
jgi:hypothetical protein